MGDENILCDGELHSIGWVMNKVALEDFLVKNGVKCGSGKSFEESIKTNRINPYTVDKNGRTFLHYAVMHPNPELAKILIKKYKLDPNQADKYGNTPIMCFSTAVGGTESMVNDNISQMIEILIKGGANIDSQNCDGNTVLHIAARNNNQFLVPVLLSNGADESKRNKLGQTAKCISNFYENRSYLYKKIKQKDDYFQSKLSRFKRGTEPMKAVEEEKFELAKEILNKCSKEEKEANINCQNASGKTALILAIEENNLDMVKFLVKNGARVNEKSVFFS